MQSVAMGVYLQVTTHNAVWLGLLTLAAWMPSAISSPVGGALADRMSRERIIQISNGVMALCATTLATLYLTGHLRPIYAVLIAIVEGFAGAGSWASWQSLLRDLVETDEVLAAVSLSSAQFNLGRIIGPMLAGVVMGFGSAGWCFAINAGTFYFVVLIYGFVKSRPRQLVAPVGHLFDQIRHGAKTAMAVRGTRSPILSIAVIAFILSPFISFVPTMAIEVFHAGEVGTSSLVTAQGVGAVLGAILLPALAARTSRLKVLEGSLIVMIVGLAGYAVSPTLSVAVVVMVVVGAAYIGTLTGLNSVVQLHAPGGERSRILSLYTMSMSVAYPLGAFSQSFFVHRFGLRPVTLISTGLMVCVYLAVRAGAPRFISVMGDTPTPSA